MSPVVGDGGQSSSVNSDDITNQENRPHNQMNGGAERTKKTSRKKWVPLAIDVRTSRGRKDRVSGGGGASTGGGTSSRSSAGGGRTRNRDSIGKEPGTGSGAPAPGESWRGDTERRATSFGKNPRGPRPSSAVPGTAGAGPAAPMVNGGPGYRRPHPSRRGPGGGPAGVGGFKKGEPGRISNGKVETGTGAPLTELKNGAPLYYVPASYRADPAVYLKECIRHQM